MRISQWWVSLCVLWLIGAGASPAWAQRGPDLAIRFFAADGAYCFRLAPEGVPMSDESEWTVMLLTGAENRRNSFRIRTLEPAQGGARGRALTDLGLVIAGNWRMDSTRTEFFERFADGIRGRTVRARVVKFAPPGLASMTARQRGEAYLKFSDKGEKVDFGKVNDLSAEEFLSFESYVPD